MIQKILWDSDLFSLNVGFLDSSKKNDLTQVELSEYNLLYVFSDKKNDSIVLKEFIKSYSEEKVIFQKELREVIFDSQDNVIELSESYNLKELYKLAYISGEFSRFKMDPNFSISQFQNLYKLWIDNSINKKIADMFFVYQNEYNRVLGLITLKINIEQKIATVGLLGVLDDAQGRGIGTSLLTKVEQEAIKHDIKILRIPTQRHNVKACSFYLRNKYEIYESNFIEHFWRI